METREILEKLNENSKECIIKNRRKGPDFWLQFINLIGLIIWGGWLALFAVCESAEIRLFDFNQKANDLGKVELLNVAFSMATIMFFVSASLLIISLKRTRRKTDKIKITLLISEVISFIIGILLLVKMY